MQEKLLTFLLHMKKLITQILSSLPVATGHLFIVILFYSLLFLSTTRLNNTKCYESNQLQPDGCKLFVLLMSLIVNEK